MDILFRVAALGRKNCIVFDFTSLKVINEVGHVYLLRGTDVRGQALVAVIKDDNIHTYSMQEWDCISRVAGSMLSA
jgi:hypothetical protein